MIDFWKEYDNHWLLNRSGIPKPSNFDFLSEKKEEKKDE